MRISLRTFGLGVLLTVSAGVLAAGNAADQVAVDGAYVRAVPPGQPNSAAFMTLRNAGEADHAVVAAASQAAKVVELHTHTMVNGMMQMRRIPRIDVAATSSTELRPGGLHIMLINLRRPLRVGDTVSLTLKFADGSEKQVEAPVRTITDSMSMGHGAGGNMRH
jgi:copper(I)-binding protein